MCFAENTKKNQNIVKYSSDKRKACWTKLKLFSKKQMHVRKWWQHSKECMCRLQNIAMHDYQESVTTGQIDRRMDRHWKSYPYESLCFTGDTLKLLFMMA